MLQSRCTKWLRTALSEYDLSEYEAGVDCNHAFVHDNQTSRGVCIVDSEALAAKTPGMQDWPIEVHNISASVHALLKALGVETCRCRRKSVLFVGSSVMGHLFSAIRFEVQRLLGSRRCDACFTVQNGATLFFGNSLWLP